MKREQAKQQLLDEWWKSGRLHDRRVLRALQKVKRESFVSPGDVERAYQDNALPLGAGQTISQPSTVMEMTQALNVFSGAHVLEIGTGSGYQAALLGVLAGKKGKVITLERKKVLADRAEKNLQQEGLRNIKIVLGDGSSGYKKAAPYDRIIVTAAAPTIPLALLGQLKQGGILIVPVGSLFEQELLRVSKKREGYYIESLGLYQFVPLMGRWGFQKNEVG